MRSHGGPVADRERGFTLIEMIVALALFALIGIAALALVNTIVAARARTQGRLDRLADLDRAATLIDADLGQLAPGPIEAGAFGFAFNRNAARAPAGHARIGYALRAGMLERTIDGRRHALLGDVAAVRLAFYLAGSGWRDRWPPSPRQAADWPAAVAIEITLAPQPNRPTGTLRRIVLLPAHP